MAKKMLFKAGEATMFASEGQYTDAMPEVLVADVSGPAGHAFANMMAQSKGHTCMFAVRACNHMVRPPTMMATKVTIKDEAYVNLFGGIVQSATADAITDCVAEGIVPKSQVDNLCILCLLWIDPRAPKDPKRGEPTVKQLLATRKKVKHDMFDAASGTWF